MKTKILALLLLPFLLVACTTPITHSTASGKPETTISGVTKGAVRERITDEMLNKGYTIAQSSDSLIVFEQTINNAIAAYMFSTKFSSTPMARISYSLAETKKGIRIIADCSAVSNPGSGFERKTSLNNTRDGMVVQNFLTALEASMKRK